MENTIFVYGSLMADEVILKLIHRVPTKREATVQGYKRYKLKNRSYPGAFQQERSSIKGLLFFGINEEEMNILDAFEGREYKKEEISAEVEGGERISASMYTYIETSVLLHEEDEWSYSNFREYHLAQFVATCFSRFDT